MIFCMWTFRGMPRGSGGSWSCSNRRRSEGFLKFLEVPLKFRKALQSSGWRYMLPTHYVCEMGAFCPVVIS
jgi:hypothetical protein